MERATPERLRAPLLMAAAVLMGVAPALGVAFAPALLVHAPLGLVALNPAGSYLVIVATLVPMSLFIAVGAARRCLSALLGYTAGYVYGDRTIEWIEEKSPRFGSMTRVLEKAFDRLGPVLLVLAPGMTFGALAGMAKMRLWLTVALLLLGQVMWLSITFYLGGALREWILPIVAFLTSYMIEATVVCAFAVVVWHTWRRLQTAH